MAVHNHGWETRMHRPRQDPDEVPIGMYIKEKLPASVICLVTGGLGDYTRFKTSDLKPNLALFKKLYKASHYRKVKGTLNNLSPKTAKSIVGKVAGEVLDMCQLVLPENSTTAEAKMLIGKKRSALKLFGGNNTMFINAVRQSEELTAKALKVIDTHLFGFLAPLEIDFSVVEPSEIADIAYPTMKHVYNLLLGLVAVADTSLPVFAAIEAYPDFIQKLHQLLYLPDARERKDLEVILINLFNCHSSMQKDLIAMLRFKYEEMQEYFTQDYAFIYHDLLAVHRGYYLIVKEDEERQNGALAIRLQGIFRKHVIPLVGLSDLADFADQWTFIMMEVGQDVDDALYAFLDEAFSLETPRTHYHRDLETLNILENVLNEIEMPASVWVEVIKFFFVKACKMIIRPSMHEIMLTKFFGSTSLAWTAFDTDSGTLRYDFQFYPLALFEINGGLRNLFIALHEMEFEIPELLLDLIDLWMPSMMFLETFAPCDSGFFDVEAKLLKGINDRYIAIESLYASQ